MVRRWQPFHVLHVEDNRDGATLIDKLLSCEPKTKITTVVETTLAGALARMEKENFDAVLLDLHLPDVQGIEGLIELQKKHPDTPVVVLTGDAREEVIEAALQAGAQDYLIKGGVLYGDLVLRAIYYSTERHKYKRRLHTLVSMLQERVRELETIIRRNTLDEQTERQLSDAGRLTTEEKLARSSEKLQRLTDAVQELCKVNLREFE